MVCGLVVLGALAIAWPALARAAWLADVLVFAALVADFLATPDPRKLAVTRTLPERAGLGEEFARRLRVEAGRARGLVLEVREEFSAALEVCGRDLRDDLAAGPSVEDGAACAPPVPGDPTGGPDRARLPPAGAIELVRSYRSRRRGIESLGHLRLRLRGPLGLVLRQARLAGRSEIAIQPALLGLSRTLELAASERWRDLGVRRVRRRGGLTEFESLRDYVAGDDVRLVDWKAFARRGRPMVREHQEEHGQELILCIDCGRRMAQPAGQGAERGWTKLDHALDAALQIAAVALQEGDRVGIFAFDARPRAWVAPARGARAHARLEQAVFALLPSLAESDLEGALREIGVRQRRRATLILFSDVADPLSLELQGRALEVGARRHRIVFAALDDPEIRRVATAESHAAAALRAVALLLSAERQHSLARLRSHGASVLDALPAEAAAPALAAWLDAKRSGRS